MVLKSVESTESNQTLIYWCNPSIMSSRYQSILVKTILTTFAVTAIISIIFTSSPHSRAPTISYKTRTVRPEPRKVVLPTMLNAPRNNQPPKSNYRPQILYWTGYFGGDLEYHWSKETIACPDIQCDFIKDRTRYKEADMLVFHQRDMNWTILPAIRYPWQIYTYFLLESPLNTFNQEPLRQYGNDFFNWTISFRRDSDIWWPESVFVQKNSTTNDDLIDIDENQSIISDYNKSIPIAWFVSECVTHSRREVFVNRLQQQIQVDVFGRCGQFQCARFNQTCYDMLAEDYWFYLAFENSVCKDYVTEKFFTALNNSIVPIVLQDSNYKHWAPKHSYIAVDTFPDINGLVKHLRYLMKNLTAYHQYFEWKNHLRINYSNRKTGLCGLCEKLKHHVSDESPKVKSYRNIYDWWIGKANCISQFAVFRF